MLHHAWLDSTHAGLKTNSDSDDPKGEEHIVAVALRSHDVASHLMRQSTAEAYASPDYIYGDDYVHLCWGT